MNPWEEATDNVGPARKPTQKEFSDWLGSKPRQPAIPKESPDAEKAIQEALEVASIYKPPRSERERQIAYLKSKNRWNWFYLKHYYKWAEKQLRKGGWDPRQARWLL